MKKIFYLGLILFISLPFSGSSQIMDAQFQEFYDDFEELKRFNERKEVTYDGTPYLNDEFLPGKIILKDGQEYKSILLRYNIYYDQFEFSKDDKIFAIDQNPDFSVVNLGKKVFIYNTYEYKGKVEKGYLEQLLEGDYSLYIKYVTILRDGEDSGAYQQAKRPSFFPQKPVFLIGDSNKNIVEVKNSKDILEKFQTLEDAIEKYSGKKKLKLKNKVDFIEFVSFLNSRSDINTD